MRRSTLKLEKAELEQKMLDIRKTIRNIDELINGNVNHVFKNKLGRTRHYWVKEYVRLKKEYQSQYGEIETR